MDTIPKFDIGRSAAYENIIVPSTDSVRQTYVFKTLVTNARHVLHPGPTGTGKSANMGLYLQKNAPENFVTVNVGFSAQTHVNQLQDFIDSKIEKRRKGVYGPPIGKKMVLFVDDLNMPMKEFYGAQSVAISPSTRVRMYDEMINSTPQAATQQSNLKIQ